MVGEAARFDPIQGREYKRSRACLQRRNSQRRLLRQAALKHRQEILSSFEWDITDVQKDSPQPVDIDTIKSCPRHFLDSLFQRTDRIWTGEVHESGCIGYTDRWRSCEEWLISRARIGPMVTPAVWQHGCHSRSSANVLRPAFTVLDFDGFDGIQPDSPEQLKIHIRHSLAIVRWLREKQKWPLAALIYTGSKSIHAWFDALPQECLESARITSEQLGVDSGLIGRPEHPCRLPGQIHIKTNKPSRTLWLREKSEQ